MGEPDFVVAQLTFSKAGLGFLGREARSGHRLAPYCI
jgi:hypothetical protein